MNIAQLVAAQAEQNPSRVAIVDTRRGEYRRTTYAELEAKSAGAAAAYTASGLRKGDTLLVFHPMSMELYAALIGAFRIGLVAMFVDPSAGRAHIGRCCALRPPDAFLGSLKAQLLALLVPAVRAAPRRFVTAGWVPGAANVLRAEATATGVDACDESHPALITFTSGSTGAPKGIVRTHGFLLAQHAALARALGYAEGERDLTTLPVFLLANLASGLTSVIADGDLRYPGRIDAARVMRQVDALDVQRTAASPAFVERLVEYCEREQRSLGSLRDVHAGGAPVFPGLIERARARLGAGGRFVAVYGSTEAEPIAHVEGGEVTDADLDAMARGRGLLTGRPVSEIALAIIGSRWGRPIEPQSAQSFEAMRLAAGETGEIVVSGAHVVGGYLNGAGDHETKFEVDGQRWHRTGDVGYLDGEGRLWLMGRAAATIADARGTLYPFAVECAAMRNPVVARAALVEHESRRILVVQPAAGARADDAAILRTVDSVAIDEVLACERIPLDARHNAKVDYPALNAWLAQRRRR